MEEGSWMAQRLGDERGLQASYNNNITRKNLRAVPLVTLLCLDVAVLTLCRKRRGQLPPSERVALLQRGSRWSCCSVQPATWEMKKGLPK